LNAEFNWWLLIVGLVIGAALVWLVLADSSRRESEISEEELPKEATWIATAMSERGRPVPPETTEEILRLHRAYLASLPPDEDEMWEDELLDAPAADGSTEGPTVDVRRSRPPLPTRQPTEVPPIRRLGPPPREEQPSQGRGA
jgi:hypothetical protein